MRKRGLLRREFSSDAIKAVLGVVIARARGSW